MYHKLIILILISTEFPHGSMGKPSNIDITIDDVPIRNKSLQQRRYDNRPKTKMMKKVQQMWIPPSATLPPLGWYAREHREEYKKTLYELILWRRDLNYRWRTASKRFEPYYGAIFMCNVPLLQWMYQAHWTRLLPDTDYNIYMGIRDAIFEIPLLTEIYTNREFALTGYAREGSVISYQCNQTIFADNSHWVYPVVEWDTEMLSKWELKWALFRLNKLRTDFGDYATIKTWTDPLEPANLFSRLDLRVSSEFSPFAVYCFINNKEETPNADGKRCENDHKIFKCCSLHPYLYEVYKPLPKPVLTMNTSYDGSYFKAKCYAKSTYYFDTFTWVIVFANDTVIYPQSRDSGHLTKYNMAMYNITLDTKLNSTYQEESRNWEDSSAPRETNIEIELTSTFEIENRTAVHDNMKLLCFTGLLDYDDPRMTSCGDRSWCTDRMIITPYETTTTPPSTTTDNPPSTTPCADNTTIGTTKPAVVPTTTTTAYVQTTETDFTTCWLIIIGVPFHIFLLFACISLMKRYSWTRLPLLKQNETVPDNAKDPEGQGSVQESDDQSTVLTLPDEEKRTRGSSVDKKMKGTLI